MTKPRQARKRNALRIRRGSSAKAVLEQARIVLPRRSLIPPVGSTTRSVGSFQEISDGHGHGIYSEVAGSLKVILDVRRPLKDEMSSRAGGVPCNTILPVPKVASKGTKVALNLEV